MKKSALPFALFVSLFAVATIAALALSDTFAATAVVISVEQQRLILKDSGTAVLGVANPEVTVVEYFDYNCPYCRKLAPSIHALVKNDQKVAVVFKEWPIFGGISVYAARSALASQWQGKYLTAHDALIGAPRLSQAVEVDQTLQNAGKAGTIVVRATSVGRSTRKRPRSATRSFANIECRSSKSASRSRARA